MGRAFVRPSITKASALGVAIVAGAFDDLVKDGKIRYYAGSEVRAEVLYSI